MAIPAEPSPAMPSPAPAAAPAQPGAAADLPRVTAVVPVRNRQQLTLRCLEQLAQQTYPNLRVLVVDSNSSDGTVAAIRTAYPQVRVLAAGDDAYWAGATNRGLRQALAQGSEWLLTINDDEIGRAHV